MDGWIDGWNDGWMNELFQLFEIFQRGNGGNY